MQQTQSFANAPVGISVRSIHNIYNKFVVGNIDTAELQAQLKTETKPCEVNPLMTCANCGVHQAMAKWPRTAIFQARTLIPCARSFPMPPR